MELEHLKIEKPYTPSGRSGTEGLAEVVNDLIQKHNKLVDYASQDVQSKVREVFDQITAEVDAETARENGYVQLDPMELGPSLAEVDAMRAKTKDSDE